MTLSFREIRGKQKKIALIVIGAKLIMIAMGRVAMFAMAAKIAMETKIAIIAMITNIKYRGFASVRIDKLCKVHYH